MTMESLLAHDAAFYVVSAGVLACALLWPFFLLKYRTAEEPSQEAAISDAEPIRPVSNKESSPKPVPVSAAPSAEVPKVASVQEKSPAKAESRAAASSAAAEKTVKLSAPPAATPAPAPAKAEAPPATVGAGEVKRLQDQLGVLGQEVRGLKEQLATLEQKHESQFTTLLKRLGELKQDVSGESASPSVPAAAPAAVPAQEVVIPMSLPAAAVQEPQAPKQEPAKEPTLKIELSSPEAQPAPAPAEAPPPEQEKDPLKDAASRRKGPVWPV